MVICLLRAPGEGFTLGKKKNKARQNQTTTTVPSPSHHLLLPFGYSSRRHPLKSGRLMPRVRMGILNRLKQLTSQALHSQTVMVFCTFKISNSMILLNDCLLDLLLLISFKKKKVLETKLDVFKNFLIISWHISI